jgi:hypothetical protein
MALFGVVSLLERVVLRWRPRAQLAASW